MIIVDKTEKRELTTNKIELREDENGVKTIRGYAVKWEMKSQVMGFFKQFREQFKKGAFAESLTKDDQRFLWSHDTSKVLARKKNGTLRLFEDDIGLRFEADLPDTTLGRDTYTSIERGDVDGVSFGFRMTEQSIDESDEENILRTVTGAELLEVSAVAFPAYPDSEVSARGYDPIKQHEEELREEESKARIKILTIL